ncbi:sigma 54-interacting transcriptional regulator [Bacillus spongiae]|uniref:Sigma 54-interacting transcriptional regulator n=2 Tax=Bacillus spongiae TaxID=2683610 RepID=A0ABU8HET3_9BACI
MKNENLLYIYQELVEKLESGVHVIDIEGNTVIYNRKMMEIEGMSIEDVLDKNILDVFHFERDEESTLLQVLNSGQSSLNIKQTYFTKKGQEITTINNTYPLYSSGKCIGAIEIAKDVTKVERLLKEQLSKKEEYTFNSIVGSSDSIQEVIENSRHAATAPSSILLIGETGTGKEMIAQSIHNESFRRNKAFLIHHCESILPTQSEDVLFGDKGMIAQATGGTLLLTHINRMDTRLQERLLNTLQCQKTSETQTSTQVVATINEDPIDAITAGRLKKELYYKLSHYSIFIPPLRERKEDIIELAQSFIESYSLLFGSNVKALHQDVINAFINYDWPGNVRELERVIEESLNCVNSDEVISHHHLPMSFRQRANSVHKEDERFLVNPNRELLPLEEYLQEAEKYYLQKALIHHQFNITQTAKSLGMSRQNLQYRMKKNQLVRP